MLMGEKSYGKLYSIGETSRTSPGHLVNDDATKRHASTVARGKMVALVTQRTNMYMFADRRRRCFSYAKLKTYVTLFHDIVLKHSTLEKWWILFEIVNFWGMY